MAGPYLYLGVHLTELRTMLTVNKSNLYGCVWGHCALVVSGSCTKLLALDDHNVTNTCTSRACDTSPGCRACSSIENV